VDERAYVLNRSDLVFVEPERGELGQMLDPTDPHNFVIGQVEPAQPATVVKATDLLYQVFTQEQLLKLW
jgi:hypothetical protein